MSPYKLFKNGWKNFSKVVFFYFQSHLAFGLKEQLKEREGGGRTPRSKEHDQSLIQMKSAFQTHEAAKAEANTK